MRRKLVLSMAIALGAMLSMPKALALPGEDAASVLAALDNSETIKGGATAPPKAARKNGSSLGPFGTIGVAAKASSLGFGFEAGTPLTNRTNLRFGFNTFSYDRTLDRDGITYAGSLKLRSAQVLLDFFPLHGFHLSPGVLMYDGNELSAGASVNGAQTFDLGGVSYVSDPTHPLTGSGKLAFNRVAPMFVFGFGNLVPRSRHFSVNFDVGVAYHGSPKVTLDLAGNACDPTGRNCRSISDPAIQSDIQAEMDKLNHSASPYKIWPVISTSIGYRF